MIQLVEVNKENFEAVIGLSVHVSQKNYVAPNVVSIAQSKFYPTFSTQAVYHEEDLIGFVLYGFDPDEEAYSLVRLMVDKNYQGQGFGKAATLAVVERLREVEDCDEVFLSYVPGNASAERLYESVGFVKTGEIKHEEIEMCLKF